MLYIHSIKYSLLNAIKKAQFVKNMTLKYPQARRDDVKENYHGTVVSDPYRWLEDPESEETKKFVAEQNAITQPYIEGYTYKENIKRNITKLWNYPKVSIPEKEGNKYYQFKNTGLQNQSVLFKLDTCDNEGAIFLDPNLFSKDGTVSLSGMEFSRNGEVLAYGLSTSGSDWIQIKFRNSNTGEDYPEVLEKVKFSTMSWKHDHIGFFYGGYLDQEGNTQGMETLASKNHKLYYHRLGTPQSKDIIAIDFDDSEAICGATVSYCGQYLIVSVAKGTKNNLIYYANLDGDITGKLSLKPIVTKMEADYMYVTNTKSRFIFRTNKNAPNYHLILIDFNSPGEENWLTLVKEHEKNVLTWARPINTNKLVLCYIQDVKNTLSLHKLENGEKIKDFLLDIGSVLAISGKRHHNEMFFSFVTYLSPTVIYKVNFTETDVQQTLFYETKVGDFDPKEYVSKQEFYTTKDGTQIPISIIHKKGFTVDGSKPCLLYGYGGFNISLTPSFSILRIIFGDHFDGCSAIANIRGGGEYGEKWHNAGRFENKQNCFDDFQYAAKYLFQKKYTTPEKLAIMGGSNGGLLVSACMNQAPELFSSVICQVGVLDMLRFHKFTIGSFWTSDFGSSDTKEGFQYIYKYSPLHNIKPISKNTQYPALLVMTADHDDRVVPLHSLKFIAELQNKIGSSKEQIKPLMARIDTKSGHGAGKPMTKLIEEMTDILCFIAKASNLDYNE